MFTVIAAHRAHWSDGWWICFPPQIISWNASKIITNVIRTISEGNLLLRDRFPQDCSKAKDMESQSKTPGTSNHQQAKVAPISSPQLRCKNWKQRIFTSNSEPYYAHSTGIRWGSTTISAGSNHFVKSAAHPNNARCSNNLPECQKSVALQRFRIRRNY